MLDDPWTFWVFVVIAVHDDNDTSIQEGVKNQYLIVISIVSWIWMIKNDKP